MRFQSTNRKSPAVPFLEAMRNGLAPDGGLYMPETIPVLPEDFWEDLRTRDFRDIAFEMAKPFLEGEMADEALHSVVEDAFEFPVVLKEVEQNQYVLELFHGPTLAFKDFGARFMARLFSEQAAQSEQAVTILVATSGDTGSAVAHGFYKVEGVRVCLLYPGGKVSPLQEKQMTTLGENITALEVDGVFDDCQRLVKTAFTDPDLAAALQLSSANSINIARLLPQAFYYAFAAGELQKTGEESPVFSVPSGNFGNLTGGLLAAKMGLPARHFLAATNVNDVVPEFLSGAPFSPRESVPTISNAMDVGNPSNFVRMMELFGQSGNSLRRQVSGFSWTDAETRETIREVRQRTGYLLDPHTAIGYRASEEYRKKAAGPFPAVVLATAHPAKFKDIIEKEIQSEVEIPDRLRETLTKEKKSIQIGKSFDGLKDFLMSL